MRLASSFLQCRFGSLLASKFRTKITNLPIGGSAAEVEATQKWLVENRVQIVCGVAVEKIDQVGNKSVVFGRNASDGREWQYEFDAVIMV
jgi:phytoene dehydrogenase-like protein